MRIEAAVPAPGSTAADPRRIREAAQQFEALLVGQLLKSARTDGDGWFGGGSDSASAPAIEFAEEQLAAALCARGGLGLATMIVDVFPDESDPLKSSKPALASR